MADINREQLDLIRVEETVWVLVSRIDSPSYDFSLDRFFACCRPWQQPEHLIVLEPVREACWQRMG